MNESAIRRQRRSARRRPVRNHQRFRKGAFKLMCRDYDISEHELNEMLRRVPQRPSTPLLRVPNKASPTQRRRKRYRSTASEAALSSEKSANSKVNRRPQTAGRERVSISSGLRYTPQYSPHLVTQHFAGSRLTNGLPPGAKPGFNASPHWAAKSKKGCNAFSPEKKHGFSGTMQVYMENRLHVLRKRMVTHATGVVSKGAKQRKRRKDKRPNVEEQVDSAKAENEHEILHIELKELCKTRDLILQEVERVEKLHEAAVKEYESTCNCVKQQSESSRSGKSVIDSRIEDTSPQRDACVKVNGNLVKTKKGSGTEAKQPHVDAGSSMEREVLHKSRSENGSNEILFNSRVDAGVKENPKHSKFRRNNTVEKLKKKDKNKTTKVQGKQGESEANQKQKKRHKKKKKRKPETHVFEVSSNKASNTKAPPSPTKAAVGSEKSEVFGKSEMAAAVSIQSVYRGKKIRASQRKKKEGRHLSRMGLRKTKNKANRKVNSDVLAATYIQSRYRGSKARSAFPSKKLKKPQIPSEDTAAATHAAICIQSRYRGSKARQTDNLVLASPLEEARGALELLEDENTATSAAICIQSRFRGSKARQKIQLFDRDAVEDRGALDLFEDEIKKRLSVNSDAIVGEQIRRRSSALDKIKSGECEASEITSIRKASSVQSPRTPSLMSIVEDSDGDGNGGDVDGENKDADPHVDISKVRTEEMKESGRTTENVEQGRLMEVKVANLLEELNDFFLHEGHEARNTFIALSTNDGVYRECIRRNEFTRALELLGIEDDEPEVIQRLTDTFSDGKGNVNLSGFLQAMSADTYTKSAQGATREQSPLKTASAQSENENHSKVEAEISDMVSFLEEAHFVAQHSQGSVEGIQGATEMVAEMQGAHENVVDNDAKDMENLLQFLNDAAEFSRSNSKNDLELAVAKVYDELEMTEMKDHPTLAKQFSMRAERVRMIQEAKQKADESQQKSATDKRTDVHNQSERKTVHSASGQIESTDVGKKKIAEEAAVAVVEEDEEDDEEEEENFVDTVEEAVEAAEVSEEKVVENEASAFRQQNRNAIAEMSELSERDLRESEIDKVLLEENVFSSSAKLVSSPKEELLERERLLEQLETLTIELNSSLNSNSSQIPKYTDSVSLHSDDGTFTDHELEENYLRAKARQERRLRKEKKKGRRKKIKRSERESMRTNNMDVLPTGKAKKKGREFRRRKEDEAADMSAPSEEDIRESAIDRMLLEENMFSMSTYGVTSPKEELLERERLLEELESLTAEVTSSLNSNSPHIPEFADHDSLNSNDDTVLTDRELEEAYLRAKARKERRLRKQKRREHRQSKKKVKDENHNDAKGHKTSVADTESESKSEFTEGDTEGDDDDQGWARLLFDYEAQHGSEISVSKNSVVHLIKRVDEHFWFVEPKEGKSGYVQADYLEKIDREEVPKIDE